MPLFLGLILKKKKKNLSFLLSGWSSNFLQGSSFSAFLFIYHFIVHMILIVLYDF